MPICLRKNFINSGQNFQETPINSLMTYNKSKHVKCCPPQTHNQMGSKEKRKCKTGNDGECLIHGSSHEWWYSVIQTSLETTFDLDIPRLLPLHLTSLEPILSELQLITSRSIQTSHDHSTPILVVSLATTAIKATKKTLQQDIHLPFSTITITKPNKYNDQCLVVSYNVKQGEIKSQTRRINSHQAPKQDSNCLVLSLSI